MEQCQSSPVHQSAWYAGWGTPPLTGKSRRNEAFHSSQHFMKIHNLTGTTHKETRCWGSRHPANSMKPGTANQLRLLKRGRPQIPCPEVQPLTEETKHFHAARCMTKHRMPESQRSCHSQRPSASEIVYLRLWRSPPPHIGPLWTVQDRERQREHWRSSWSSLQDLQPEWARNSHPKRSAMWQDRLLLWTRCHSQARKRQIEISASQDQAKCENQLPKLTCKVTLHDLGHMRFMAEDPGNHILTTPSSLILGWDLDLKCLMENKKTLLSTPKLSSTFQEWSNNATDADDLSSS